jgi:hypothetical protein
MEGVGFVDGGGGGEGVEDLGALGWGVGLGGHRGGS